MFAYKERTNFDSTRLLHVAVLILSRYFRHIHKNVEIFIRYNESQNKFLITVSAPDGSAFVSGDPSTVFRPLLKKSILECY